MAATSSPKSTRFRFRDHTDHEGIKALDGGSPVTGLDHSSADSSSVSSDYDADSELKSMTAKVIGVPKASSQYRINYSVYLGFLIYSLYVSIGS